MVEMGEKNKKCCRNRWKKLLNYSNHLCLSHKVMVLEYFCWCEKRSGKAIEHFERHYLGSAKYYCLNLIKNNSLVR